MDRCVDLQPQNRARARTSRQSPALAFRTQRVHEWKRLGRTELGDGLFPLTPALCQGERERRNIPHSTSNSERSIPEASCDPLEVECSMLKVGCCRFMEVLDLFVGFETQGSVWLG